MILKWGFEEKELKQIYRFLDAVAKARADADMVNQDRLDKISGLADTFGTTKIEINGKTYMLTNIEKEGKK